MSDRASELTGPVAGVWVEPLVPDDGPALQALFDGLSDFEQLFGDPGRADAVSTFAALPEGKSYDDKLLLGVWEGSRLVGAADCIAAYPTAQTWTIGLFVLEDQVRRRGIGTALLRCLEQVGVAQGATTMRCVARSSNTGGAAFLRKAGYQAGDDQDTDEQVVFQKTELRATAHA